MNRDLNVWLGNYSEDHQNEVNQKIHFVFVPLIFISVLALLWGLPSLEIGPITFKWTYALVLGGTLFYLLLSPFYAVLMFVLSALCCVAFYFIEVKTQISIMWTFGAVFVVSWIAQFYGHKLEGKKPSFLTDLTYLLIGPIWILHKLRGKSIS